MAYYRHPDYCSETDMKKQGFSEDEKAEQRVSNWYIRIRHYATTNCIQFRKMVDDWAESFQFPSPGVPTMTMLHLLRLARENGICSDTLRDFARAEEDLLERIPGFVSPAAVAAALVEKTHEEVKKPKTRAERREIEPTEIDTPAAQTDKRPAKRERRCDYWVERDDKRRSAAITFKNQNQEN